MRSQLIVAIATLCAATAVSAQGDKKSGARQQLNQATQSGRTFDGNRSGSGNSTLNERDAVVRQPASGTNRTSAQAIKDYRSSGRADPTPSSFRRKSEPPPAPAR